MIAPARRSNKKCAAFSPGSFHKEPPLAFPLGWARGPPSPPTHARRGCPGPPRRRRREQKEGGGTKASAARIIFSKVRRPRWVGGPRAGGVFQMFVLFWLPSVHRQAREEGERTQQQPPEKNGWQNGGRGRLILPPRRPPPTLPAPLLTPSERKWCRHLRRHPVAENTRWAFCWAR